MIVCADLASAELRVIAALSKDKYLNAAFAEGRNIHLENAKEIFGSRVVKGDDDYTLTKSAIFRFAYIVPGKIPTDVGSLRLTKGDVTPELLASVFRGLDKKLLGVLNWKRKVIAELHATHKVRNIYGRYRDLKWGLMTWAKEVVESAEQAALNFPVQSVIARKINDAIIAVDDWCDAERERGFQAWPILNVHDEIAIYTPLESEVVPCLRALKRAMEAPIKELNNLIIPAEPRVGKNWGQLVAYEGVL